MGRIDAMDAVFAICNNVLSMKQRRNQHSLGELVRVWFVFVLEDTLARLRVAHAWHRVDCVTLGGGITHFIWLASSLGERATTSTTHRAQNVLGGALNARAKELVRLWQVNRCAHLIRCAEAASK